MPPDSTAKLWQKTTLWLRLQQRTVALCRMLSQILGFALLCGIGSTVSAGECLVETGFGLERPPLPMCPAEPALLLPPSNWWPHFRWLRLEAAPATALMALAMVLVWMTIVIVMPIRTIRKHLSTRMMWWTAARQGTPARPCRGQAPARAMARGSSSNNNRHHRNSTRGNHRYPRNRQQSDFTHSFRPVDGERNRNYRDFRISNRHPMGTPPRFQDPTPWRQPPQGSTASSTQSPPRSYPRVPSTDSPPVGSVCPHHPPFAVEFVNSVPRLLHRQQGSPPTAHTTPPPYDNNRRPSSADSDSNDSEPRPLEAGMLQLAPDSPDHGPTPHPDVPRATALDQRRPNTRPRTSPATSRTSTFDLLGLPPARRTRTHGTPQAGPGFSPYDAPVGYAYDSAQCAVPRTHVCTHLSTEHTFPLDATTHEEERFARESGLLAHLNGVRVGEHHDNAVPLFCEGAPRRSTTIFRVTARMDPTMGTLQRLAYGSRDGTNRVSLLQERQMEVYEHLRNLRDRALLGVECLMWIRDMVERMRQLERTDHDGMDDMAEYLSELIDHEWTSHKIADRYNAGIRMQTASGSSEANIRAADRFKRKYCTPAASTAATPEERAFENERREMEAKFEAKQESEDRRNNRWGGGTRRGNRGGVGTPQANRDRKDGRTGSNSGKSGDGKKPDSTHRSSGGGGK